MEIFINLPLTLCTLYLFTSFSPVVIASRRPWTTDDKRCSIPLYSGLILTFTNILIVVIEYVPYTFGVRQRTEMIIDVSGGPVGPGQGGPEL